MFPIGITSRASAAAAEQLQKRGFGKAIRLGVKGGGCSGFQYVIQFCDEEPKETDEKFFDGETTWIIDKKSAAIISGSAIDWVEHGIMKRGFEFINPNEISKCGCGKSFRTRIGDNENEEK